MKFRSLKTLALVSTAIIGLSVPASVNAAPNALVTVDINTQAGITALTNVDMDFGSWLIGVHPGDAPTVIMAAADGALSTTTGVSSQLIELTGAANGTQGELLVTLPAGADGLTVQMSRGAIADFAGGDLSLTAVTYVNSDNGAQTGTLLEATPVPIDIAVGATGATVSFGGTVTASATPAGDGVTHTASFNVSFAY